MVIVLAGILASAFLGLTVPQINLFFYLPERMRVQNACADLLDIIVLGDSKAKGLSFARPIISTSATATCGLTAAFNGAGSDPRSGLTYTYQDKDLATTSHTIVLKYFLASHTVTRSIDGGADTLIPYYASSASGTKFDPLETNFFRFWTYGGGTPAEITGTLSAVQVETVYRVDIPVNATSGNAAVKSSAGSIQMKADVDIKHYWTAEAPDI